MRMPNIPAEDQEAQHKAFVAAVTGLPRVLAQIKRRTGLAVQFQPELAERLNDGGIQLEEHPDPNEGIVPGHVAISQWSCFGVPIDPGDYIVNVSGEGIRIVTKVEFLRDWEVVGDA